jgi:hypothetical protein
VRYLLRTRNADSDLWSDSEEFFTRRERDKAAQQARCLFGVRVWRIDESTPRKRRGDGDGKPSEAVEPSKPKTSPEDPR